MILAAQASVCRECALHILFTGASGEMEVLNYGKKISKEEYLRMQEYALGKLFFKLSKIKVLSQS